MPTAASGFDSIHRKSDVTIDFGLILLDGELVHDDEHRELHLLADEGIEHLSVNLGTYGVTAAPGHVFIKDWSEHHGLASRMQDAGLVEIVDTIVVGPFASQAHEVRITL